VPSGSHLRGKLSIVRKDRPGGEAPAPQNPFALEELQRRAQETGANAVVGIDLDYEVLGQGNGMLMVSASGTGVVVE